MFTLKADLTGFTQDLISILLHMFLKEFIGHFYLRNVTTIRLFFLGKYVYHVRGGKVVPLFTI